MSAPTLPATSTGATNAGRALLFAALALTALVYAATLRFGFVYDDAAQIVLNPVVQSWRFAPHYFTQHVWSNLVNAPATYYRPLFSLWCLVNFTLFGLQAWGWHLTTVLVHLAVTALVFRLAQRLTGDGVTAGFAALIFGLHPIHIESVAWISGIPDAMLAVFFISAFLCWLNYRECRPHRGAWLAAALVLFALAAISKETGIVLPLVIFAYEWLRARNAPWPRRLGRSLAQTAPFAGVALLYLVQRSVVLHGITHPRIPLPGHVVPLTWPSLLWFYLRKLVWPLGLSPFYDRPYVFAPDWRLFWGPLLGLAAVASLVTIAVRRLAPIGSSQRRSDEPIERRGDGPIRCGAAFALVLLLAPLLPVLEILSLEPREIAHDRYLYLPSLGFALLVAMLIRRLRFGAAEIFRLPTVQFAAMAALTVACGAAISLQSQHWANDIVLFYRAVRIAPSSESATNNLANALLARGYYDEGIRLHQQLLQRDPRYWLSYYNLGNAFYQLHRLDEAERNLFEAAKLQPANPQLFVFLGLVQSQNGHLREAQANLREAIRIGPTGLGAHYLLGTLLAQEGRFPEAATEFRAELALDPAQPKVREELNKLEGRR